MKKYDSYKDSGVEWIGDLPSNWQIKRIKHTTYVKGRIGWQGMRSDEFLESSDSYVVTGTDFMKGLVKWDTCYQVPLERYEEDPFIQLREGDLLITKDGTIGKIAVVKDIPKIATLNSGVFLTRPLFDSYVPEFMYWILYSEVFKTFYDYNKSGSTIQHLYQNVFNEFKFPLPTIKEQTTIANYLDQKTTQIDHLIAKKEQFIQLLEEERVAVINQAVTKGLDPNVLMKDSGIEWLGEIPEHWELWKISHAFKRIGSGTTPESGNPIYHENGTINWLNTGDLNDGEVVLCNKKITEQAIFDYTSLKLFPAGSLVMAMYGATIGKTGFIKFDTTTNQACCVFCEGEIIDLKFLQYWFLAKKENIINLAIGGGQPNISQNILKDIRVNCPSISEQLSIVKYLDLKTKEIDLVESKAYQEIELLKEYKTAIISEVVTGKVDVRNEKLN